MRSILFVDDDKRLLQGMRRLLSDQRAEWQLTFVSSGARALQLLEIVDFDALVTDLRMPGLDGVDVLEATLARQPQCARLLLSGVENEARRWTADALVHRALAKPCSPQQLKLELRTALSARDQLAELSDARLERLWSRPPGTRPDALAVRLACARGEGLPDTLVQRLEAGREPALARALALAWPDLDLASASAFELAGRLGGRTLLQIVLALRFVELMADDAPDWDAALASAEAVIGLTRMRSGGDAGAADALIAGLLGPSCAVDGGQAALDLVAYSLGPWDFAPAVVEALTGVGALRRGAGTSGPRG